MFWTIRKEKGKLKNIYKIYKARKKIKILKLFDERYYLKKYPHIKKSRLDPLTHYLYYGYKEGKHPNMYFDEKYYLKKYPAVKKAKMNPLIHYALYGKEEMKYPNEKIENIKFDENYYLKKYPDAKKSKVNPVEHYLEFGEKGGRYPNREIEILNNINPKKPKLKKDFKISIKIPVPKKYFKGWGDYYFSLSLKKEFEKRNIKTEIHFIEEWYKSNYADLVIVLRGITPYITNKNQYNIMWNISHPDMVSNNEYEDYDLVFTCSETYTNELKDKVNVPVETLLQCSDEEIFFPEKSSKYQSELLFIANTRKVFRKIIKDLDLDKNLNKNLNKDLDYFKYNIKIYGKGWENFIDKKYIYGKNIAHSELNKYYSSSKILLNDHWEDMAKKGFVSNRIFDGFASGAFIISDKVKDMDKIFGESIVTYSKKEELNKLIEYYLNNKKEREKNIKKNREIILNNHLFKHRVESILDFVLKNWV
ncbi:CgeB family protein [Methanobrevibacter curvatus]|uniref:Spore protein YkvP n=1 Tax=Methanobrevibacter curvatus TaxID=49547 RepID=A0A166B3S0_9EURY|nr:glycosyltransferase [Methanobrevibacter curvatus]KZX12826.1 spore protein YkvP [Methanobrevibacter curvatus]